MRKCRKRWIKDKCLVLIFPRIVCPVTRFVGRKRNGYGEHGETNGKGDAVYKKRKEHSNKGQCGNHTPRAKEIKFNTKLLVDGKEKLVTNTSTVAELHRDRKTLPGSLT